MFQNYSVFLVCSPIIQLGKIMQLLIMTNHLLLKAKNDVNVCIISCYQFQNPTRHPSLIVITFTRFSENLTCDLRP